MCEASRARWSTFIAIRARHDWKSMSRQKQYSESPRAPKAGLSVFADAPANSLRAPNHDTSDRKTDGWRLSGLQPRLHANIGWNERDIHPSKRNEREPQLTALEGRHSLSQEPPL